MIRALTTDSAPSTTSARLVRLADALEWPVAFLALLIVPALVLEERATDPRLREAAFVTNWIVWLAFVARVRNPVGGESAREISSGGVV